MKTISASAIKIRWTAVTVSLAGHALAAAAVGPDTALPPRDSPPITVELVLLDEPGSSPEIPAGPSPPDIARDLAPVPVGTAAPAAPGARTLRVGVREETPRAAPAARTPKPRRNAPLPRIKPPTPQAVPDGATAVGLPDREDMSAVDAPPWGPADTGWNRPSAVSRSAADTPRRDRPDASSGASPRSAYIRQPAETRTGVTRGVRVAAQNRPPGYPFAARRLELEGQVLLRVEVDRAGAVERVTVTRSSGHGLLDEAARRAVNEWRFLPATVDGEAVSGAVDVPVSFRLR